MRVPVRHRAVVVCEEGWKQNENGANVQKYKYCRKFLLKSRLHVGILNLQLETFSASLLHAYDFDEIANICDTENNLNLC